MSCGKWGKTVLCASFYTRYKEVKLQKESSVRSSLPNLTGAKSA